MTEKLYGMQFNADGHDTKKEIEEIKDLIKTGKLKKKDLPKIKNYINKDKRIANELYLSNPADKALIQSLVKELKNIKPEIFEDLKKYKLVDANGNLVRIWSGPKGVKFLQVMLNHLSGANLKVDGAYGPKTFWALVQYQKNSSLYKSTTFADVQNFANAKNLGVTFRGNMNEAGAPDGIADGRTIFSMFKSIVANENVLDTIKSDKTNVSDEGSNIATKKNLVIKDGHHPYYPQVSESISNDRPIKTEINMPEVFEFTTTQLNQEINKLIEKKLGPDLAKKLIEYIKVLRNLEYFSYYLAAYAGSNNIEKNGNMSQFFHLLDTQDEFVDGADIVFKGKAESYARLIKELLKYTIKGDKAMVKKFLSMRSIDKQINGFISDADGVEIYQRFIKVSKFDDPNEKAEIANIIKNGAPADIVIRFAKEMKSPDFVFSQVISSISFGDKNFPDNIYNESPENAITLIERTLKNFKLFDIKINGLKINKDKMRHLLIQAYQEAGNFPLKERYSYVFDKVLAEIMEENEELIKEQLPKFTPEQQKLIKSFYENKSWFTDLKNHWASYAYKVTMFTAVAIATDGLVTEFLAPAGGSLASLVTFGQRVVVLQNVMGDMSLLFNDKLTLSNALDVASDIHGYLHIAAYMTVLETVAFLQGKIEKLKGIKKVSGTLEKIGKGKINLKNLALYGINVGGILTIDTVVFHGEFNTEELMNALVFAALMGGKKVEVDKLKNGKIKFKVSSESETNANINEPFDIRWNNLILKEINSKLKKLKVGKEVELNLEGKNFKIEMLNTSEYKLIYPDGREQIVKGRTRAQALKLIKLVLKKELIANSNKGNSTSSSEVKGNKEKLVKNIDKEVKAIEERLAKLKELKDLQDKIEKNSYTNPSDANKIIELKKELGFSKLAGKEYFEKLENEIIKLEKQLIKLKKNNVEKNMLLREKRLELDKFLDDLIALSEKNNLGTLTIVEDIKNLRKELIQNIKLLSDVSKVEELSSEVSKVKSLLSELIKKYKKDGNKIEDVDYTIDLFLKGEYKSPELEKILKDLEKSSTVVGKLEYKLTLINKVYDLAKQGKIKLKSKFSDDVESSKKEKFKNENENLSQKLNPKGIIQKIKEKFFSRKNESKEEASGNKEDFSDLLNYKIKIDKISFEEFEKLPKTKMAEKFLEKYSDFRPSKKITVNGQEFYLPKEVIGSGSRLFTVVYAKNPEGNVDVRFFYKSLSDGSWRSTPGLEGRIYSKGKSILGKKYSYVATTEVNDFLVNQLDSLPIVTKEISLSELMSDPQLRKLKSVKEEYSPILSNDFKKEIKGSANNKVIGDGDEYGARGHLNRDLMGKEFSKPEFENFLMKLESIKYPDGFVPDFSKKPISSYEFEHSLLGPCKVEKYIGKLNGKELVWEMAYTKNTVNGLKEPIVWVKSIRPIDAKLTSFGTYDSHIDAGILTIKPVEYDSQLPKNFMSFPAFRIDGNYMLTMPILHRLKPIRDFYKEKFGIDIQKK